MTTILPDAPAGAYTFSSGSRRAASRLPVGTRADGIRGLLHLTFRRFKGKESALLVAVFLLEVADLEGRYGRVPSYPFSTWQSWAGHRAARRAGMWLAKPENRQFIARLRRNRQSKRAMEDAENLGERLRELSAVADAMDKERKQIDLDDAKQRRELEQRVQQVHQALRRLGGQIIRAAVRVGLLLDPTEHGQRLLFNHVVVRAAMPAPHNARRTHALVLNPAWVAASEKARPIRKRRAVEMRPIRPSDAPHPAVEMRPIRPSDAPHPAANQLTNQRVQPDSSEETPRAAACSATTAKTSAERAHRAAEEDTVAVARRVTAQQDATGPASEARAGPRLASSDPAGLWSLRTSASALLVDVECSGEHDAKAMARHLTRGGRYSVARCGQHGAVIEIHPAPGHGLEQLFEFASERLARWSLIGGNSIAVPAKNAQDRSCADAGLDAV